MTTILAVDPGPTQSAWTLYRGGLPRLFAKEPNNCVRLLIRDPPEPLTLVAIERVASYGMSVGKEIFDTVEWIGRFHELAADRWPVVLVYRQEVKLHLCHSMKANDSTIRTAIIDRYGPGKELAIGSKAKPGPLYGIKSDIWSSLAIACTVADRQLSPTPPPEGSL